MRVAMSVIALALAAGAAAEPPAQTAPLGVPGPVPDLSPAPLDQGRAPCRDTILQVREARGLPPLDRENAAPEPPELIAAVDHRIGGCSVMVMYNNTSDVRPLPALPDRPPRLQRIPR